MSEDDTRDRLIALEVQVEQLVKTVEAMAVDVRHTRDIIQQMKGARYALAAICLAIGAALANVPKLFALFGKA